MRVGCYVLYVSCDVKGEEPYYGHNQQWEYTGKNRTDCEKQARADGWTRHHGSDRCPFHSGRSIYQEDN